ncbi:MULTISPECIES: thioredoxin family protein [unclassified Thioalkalivibrio]|uniref:glutaredoxin family protein n=1 Tax=unclassified Thioalkalivibrio TaxID=2621013 RepID=UPI000375A3F4|nr:MULTISPECIES: thioredoxin family protein [unclassified Thioalkalivibrio]
MKVELLVSEWCASCHDAERIWRQVAEDKQIDFAVVDMGQPEGRELATRLRIRSIPAVVVDGELKHIGLLDRTAATELVGAAPERTQKAARHVGLGLSPSSRASVLGAMVWLLIAGAALPLGGFFLEGAARPAALHGFTLGFLLLLIMGLGEHMLPRFTGHPIAGGWLWAWAPQILVHLAVVGMGLGWILGVAMLTAVGALAALIGLALFTVRVVPLLVRPSL